MRWSSRLPASPKSTIPFGPNQGVRAFESFVN
jgi:hypothetical protein